MNLESKIAAINRSIENYFNKHPYENMIPAKELMPYFIKAGIFNKDHKNGLPIRKVLRELDKTNSMMQIPFVHAERKAKNINWFFVRRKNTTRQAQQESPTKPVQAKKIVLTKDQSVLPDVLEPDLKVIFCGTAAGEKSAKLKAYYAGPGNKFYKTIHSIGLTSKLLQTDEFKTLTQYGVGLTDLAKKSFGNDDTLKSDHFDVETFRQKILKYQPTLVCFNGKAAASVFLFGRKDKTGNVSYGLLPNTIGKTNLYVAPSTSGAANSSWDLSLWEKLLNHI